MTIFASLRGRELADIDAERRRDTRQRLEADGLTCTELEVTDRVAVNAGLCGELVLAQVLLRPKVADASAYGFDLHGGRMHNCLSICKVVFA
jgi:hypothetical protein